MKNILPFSVIFAKEKKEDESLSPAVMKKPSELPIYESLYKYEYINPEKSKLEENVSIVRKEVESLIQASKESRDYINHVYETGKAHTATTIDYIMAEENVSARAGAITVGGLTGLLLAVRKGFFKKLLYSSFGAGAVASMCYPRYTIQLSEEAVTNAKTYGAIGYNFIIGAKPQNKEEDVKQAPSDSKKVITAVPVVTEVRNLRKSFDTLVEQSSDIMVWGFRLFNRQIENTDKVTPSMSSDTLGVQLDSLLAKDVGKVLVSSVAKVAVETAKDDAELVSKAAESVNKISGDVVEVLQVAEKISNIVTEIPGVSESFKKEVGSFENIVENVETIAEVVEESSKKVKDISENISCIASDLEVDIEKTITKKKDEIIAAVDSTMKHSSIATKSKKNGEVVSEHDSSFNSNPELRESHEHHNESVKSVKYIPNPEMTDDSLLNKMEDFEDMLIDALLQAQQETKTKESTKMGHPKQSVDELERYAQATESPHSSETKDASKNKKEPEKMKTKEGNKDVVTQLKDEKKKPKEIEGDMGQSCPDDKDMYTTRS